MVIKKATFEEDSDATEAPDDSSATSLGDISLSPRHSNVGPLDASSMDALPSEGYADLGVIRIKPIPGMQVNMPAVGKQYSPLTFIAGNAALQVTVFAVPRDEDGRVERYRNILEAYASGEAKVSSVETRYGTEIHVKTPVTTPDGRAGIGVIRIILVSGDRWVAQIVMHGEAVDTQSSSAQIFDDFIDSMVVVRGNTPAAPYSILIPSSPSELIESMPDAL